MMPFRNILWSSAIATLTGCILMQTPDFRFHFPKTKVLAIFIAGFGPIRGLTVFNYVLPLSSGNRMAYCFMMLTCLCMFVPQSSFKS
jgi:hypothetical protein